MATQLTSLDPSDPNLTSSQAFSHALPQIRQFHRQLSTTLDDKNARLRTLVGGSYRELLGTAETILEMRKEIQVVEAKLGRIGEGCGRESIGRGVRGLGKLHGEGGRGWELRRKELEWIAKIKELSACALVVGRLLKKATLVVEERGESLVLAAKILVLSRLLGKSVSDLAGERDQDDQDVAEELKRRLGTLRRRLLRTIETTLLKTTTEPKDGLTQALAAYSLATSSGAKDVLRHFLHIRGEAIALAFEYDESKNSENDRGLKAMKLYTATLLDVQALVPRTLSEALARLKTTAILKDETVRELEGLRLDVCEKWLGDEISHFTPYLRHDDLDISHASDTLKRWSKRAMEVLLQGLTQDLQGSPDFRSVIELRTQILDFWIKEGGKAKGFDPSILLDGVRRVINERLVELLDSRVSKLHLIGTEVEATLGSWERGVTDKYDTLWEESMLTMEISDGATSFKDAILSRSNGRNDPVRRVFNGYRTWRHLIDEITILVEQLGKQRWDDNLEDIEDDLVLESRNTALSQEDPQMLHDELDTRLQTAFQELHMRIEQLLKKYQDHESIGQIPIYALRVIRDIRANLPTGTALRSFGLSLIPELHQQLANSISLKSVSAFVKNSRWKRVSARALWEGDPELPVQPTPNTFKFLRALSKAMGDAGSDLWSLHAVQMLKGHISTELSKSWVLPPANKEPHKLNGTAATGDSEVVVSAEEEIEGVEGGKDRDVLQRELLIQSLFDLLVIKEVFVSNESEWVLVEKDIDAKLDLDTSSKRRLQHGAREFWKRTSLLFGLLA